MLQQDIYSIYIVKCAQSVPKCIKVYEISVVLLKLHVPISRLIFQAF